MVPIILISAKSVSLYIKAMAPGVMGSNMQYNKSSMYRYDLHVCTPNMK